MRLKICHTTRLRFTAPVRNLITVLRLSPRNHDAQHVVDWRLDVDIDCRLRRTEDPHGNVLCTFSAAGPLAGIAITAEGVLDLDDNAGIVRGTAERCPLDIYLRETALTRADPALRVFASEIERSEADPLSRLHALMGRLHGEFAFEREAAPVGAALALPRGQGCALDHAHLSVSCARLMGVPARVVSGYLCEQGPDGAVAGDVHAWMEAHVPGYGWIGFDSTQDLCPKDQHARVACGLDGDEVMSLRSAFVGSGAETRNSELRVGAC